MWWPLYKRNIPQLADCLVWLWSNERGVQSWLPVVALLYQKITWALEEKIIHVLSPLSSLQCVACAYCAYQSWSLLCTFAVFSSSERERYIYLAQPGHVPIIGDNIKTQLVTNIRNQQQISRLVARQCEDYMYNHTFTSPWNFHHFTVSLHSSRKL